MKNFVITIARGYGSGGRVFGRVLCNGLGIACFDVVILFLGSVVCGFFIIKCVDVDV